MSDSDKKIKHFVCSRFFPGQNPKYPHDVLDVNFLSTQLPLVRNALSSLENQTNKNFELVFDVNWRFFGHPKYDFVFQALRDSTTLPVRFISAGNKSYLLEEALKEYDFVIYSNLDFDDFLYKDGIADTQNKVNECDNILCYGYCKGYRYLNGELYPATRNSDNLDGKVFSILFSTIVKSSVMKEVPIFFHHVLKKQLKEFVEKNGMEFSENMFQQNTSDAAFIYFRHESCLDYSKGIPHLTSKKQLTNEDGITKKSLEDEFGFHLALKSIQ